MSVVVMRPAPVHIRTEMAAKADARKRNLSKEAIEAIAAMEQCVRTRLKTRKIGSMFQVDVRAWTAETDTTSPDASYGRDDVLIVYDE